MGYLLYGKWPFNIFLKYYWILTFVNFYSAVPLKHRDFLIENAYNRHPIGRPFGVKAWFMQCHFHWSAVWYMALYWTTSKNRTPLHVKANPMSVLYFIQWCIRPSRLLRLSFLSDNTYRLYRLWGNIIGVFNRHVYGAFVRQFREGNAPSKDATLGIVSRKYSNLTNDSYNYRIAVVLDHALLGDSDADWF